MKRFFILKFGDGLPGAVEQKLITRVTYGKDEPDLPAMADDLFQVMGEVFNVLFTQ